MTMTTPTLIPIDKVKIEHVETNKMVCSLYFKDYCIYRSNPQYLMVNDTITFDLSWNRAEFEA